LKREARNQERLGRREGGKAKFQILFPFQI
jgi:hypothetical protein